jgi:DNA-binding NarL/FixJ family response regulator
MRRTDPCDERRLAADLLSAIRAVASGDSVVAPSATRRLLERFIDTLPARGRQDPHVLDALTPREREVLGLVAQGLSNAKIAARLYLSEGTVKTHVGRVQAKLGVQDRVQAVVISYEAQVDDLADDLGLGRVGAHVGSP